MTELAVNLNLPYVERTQRVGEALFHPIDWTGWLSNSWRPGADLSAGFRIRPVKPTGFQYVASAGTTGAIEPIWPIILGDPILSKVLDGSVTWTAEAVATNSLSGTISSSAWAADAGVVITLKSFLGQVTTALLDTTAGVDGTDYAVHNTITLGTGEIKIGTILLKVRPGL